MPHSADRTAIQVKKTTLRQLNMERGRIIAKTGSPATYNDAIQALIEFRRQHEPQTPIESHS